MQRPGGGGCWCGQDQRDHLASGTALEAGLWDLCSNLFLFHFGSDGKPLEDFEVGK